MSVFECGHRFFCVPMAHDLCHTAASLAILAGANPKVVQRMLGRASAAMTLDVYAKLFDSDLEEVAVTVGQNVARGDQDEQVYDAQKALISTYPCGHGDRPLHR